MIAPGTKFERWTVLKFIGRGLYECQCVCGTVKLVRGQNITRGLSKSCGCLNHGRAKTHGACSNGHSKFYMIWTAINQRCSNPNGKSWKYYGGRGIVVLWKTFEDFSRDMGASYREGLTIDRIENNGPYCKENCRWSTRREQMRNMRRNRILSFRGLSAPVSRWSEITGITSAKIRSRLSVHGWSVEKALTTP